MYQKGINTQICVYAFTTAVYLIFTPEAVFALGSYYGLLSLVEGREHLEETIETLRRAVALRPNFPQAQNDLAYFVSRSGDRAEAMEIIENVLENDPGLKDANVTYTEYLGEVGRYEEAEAALARWARIRPDDSEVVLGRARLLSRQGRLADAWRESLKLESRATEIGRSLRFVQAHIRWRLHDGRWFLDNATDTLWKAAGAILAGDVGRGVELVDGDSISRSNSAAALSGYIPAHQIAGDVDAVVAYYEAEIKTPKNAMQAASFCRCTLLPLVLGLKEAGHPDFGPLLDAWKSELEARRELFARAPDWNADRGDVAALEGDFAAAKGFYGAAMDEQAGATRSSCLAAIAASCPRTRSSTPSSRACSTSSIPNGSRSACGCSRTRTARSRSTADAPAPSGARDADRAARRGRA